MLEHALVQYLMVALFVIGYFMITIEHATKINKATVALILASLLWLLQYLDNSIDPTVSGHGLYEHLSNISQVIFFLLGALAIVETINVHRGFDPISNIIQIASKRKLLWVTGFLTFFLSSVLDNLTTTIVMVSLLSKLIEESEDRWLMGSAVVIAANAGGAWTPIGDVTTTMLWIGGVLSTTAIIKELFIPSLLCLVAALIVLGFRLSGKFKAREINLHHEIVEPKGKLVLWLGIAALISVPIFKIATGLPPFMGMLFGLGMMWLITDFFHSEYEDRNHLRIPHVLGRIDISGVLFFLGILLAIGALDTAGLLKNLALFLDAHISSPAIIATLIGLASAVVDNVPLVAASMSMYDLNQFPVDHKFWAMIAYAAGTGGSILIVGSAAGVVFMGLEKVHFFWYLKRISLAALVGFFAGMALFWMVP